MTRDQGAQRLPRSPLHPRNVQRAAGAAADAVGSSTKDRGWQQRRVTFADSRPSPLQPGSSGKKTKKVEGTVLAGPEAAAAHPAPQAAPTSRIPAASARPSMLPTSTREQPTSSASSGSSGGSSSSRIPRPPSFDAAVPAASGTSSQANLAAMLATPPAAPLLEEMHASSLNKQQHHAWASSPTMSAGVAPQGFHAYSNPSFDGAQFLAPTPSEAGAAATPGAEAVAAAEAAADTPAALRVFDNRLAGRAGSAGEELTPGMLDPAALTPNTERSLQAWLRSSPATGNAVQQQPGGRGRSVGAAAVARSPPASTITAAAVSGRAGSKSAGSSKPLHTPEAWQLLQHINDDSPAAAPKGVRGIMNAYLRTGPQMLSPEPAGADVIRAPGAAAVPASGLLNVAGPGGAGVFGMMKTYLRTAADLLSPEPGMTGMEGAGGTAAAPQQQQPVLHPYSPVSPLAATPGAVAVGAGVSAQQQQHSVLHPYSPVSPLAATPAELSIPAAGAGATSAAPRSRISPSSVCSNGNVGSTAPAAASVPRLNLGALRQGTTDGTEISFGIAAGQPGSPGSTEPTARLCPAAGASPAEAGGQEAEAADEVAGVAAQRHGPPSPITFCLPGDSPDQQQEAAHQGKDQPASDSPSFSFGFGAAAAGGLADQDAVPGVGAAAPGAAAGAEDAAGMQQIESTETVQQPHPFKAMLMHLQGPQYASPACFARIPRPEESPQSPKNCTPLHLISTSDGASPVAPTPAPGQGSLTVWMDRRGMRNALTTPLRNDLRLLWAAARDAVAYKSEAATLRADNIALAQELEATQAALRELGAEHEAAVVAAEAGALCAEAEVARARDAASHMMQLADQIQGMFALCENEKEALVKELEAAKRQLAHSEAAAAKSARRGDQHASALLQAQLEEARQAVGVAQQAADAAQQRAADAAAELESIRRQLAEAEAEVARARAAKDLTPVTKLRSQLGGVHDSLAHLHADLHCAGRLQAASPELDQLLEASRWELAHVEQLLGGGDAQVLRQENDRLQRCLSQARSLLAERSPATTAATVAVRHGSPQGAAPGEQESPVVPFALFGRYSSDEGGEGGAALEGSPDVFSSPFLASQTTLTVDYRHLHSSMGDTATSRRSSPGSVSGEDSVGDMAACWPPADVGAAGTAGQQAAECGQEEGREQELLEEDGEEEEEEEYTVVHNGMIITHVPASEVSKVKSMVQYWEAVASGNPMAATTEEEAAAAEAYANAAIAAAEAALAAQQAAGEAAAAAAAAAEAEVEVEQQEQAVAAKEAVVEEVPQFAEQEEQEEAAAEVEQELPPVAGEEQELPPVAGEEQQLQAAEETEEQAAAWVLDEQPQDCRSEPMLEQAEGAAAEQALAAGQSSLAACPSPAATPGQSRLPAADAMTPHSQQPAAAAAAAATSPAVAGTPARFTPLNFAAAPPPTPADGIDTQQAQQLYQLAISCAAAAAGGVAVTPASAQRTSSRLPGTPAGTPVSSTVALAVTPLALSALRARMNGSGGAVQDAVRSKLARLKADLQAAQAKLATVDQGLATIAFTPTSSITASGTPSSHSSSILRRTPATPLSASPAPLGSPIHRSGSSPPEEASFGSSSRAAALIAAGGASPLAPPGASPAAVSQEHQQENALEAELAAQLAADSVDDEPAAATVEAPAAAADEVVQDSNTVAAVAGTAECTPPVTRRSVRFADSVHVASNRRGMTRIGTPYSATAAAEAEVASESGSPVVGSTRRSPLRYGAAGTSPLRHTAAGASPLRYGGAGASPLQAGAQRSPLAAMQSAVKPLAASQAAAVRRFALEEDEDDSGSSSDENDDAEFLFDASRMAQGANRAATPSPARLRASASAATPMAHPEEGHGYHRGAGAAPAAAAGTPVSATSVRSTSSFSPPEPLVLLAVRPVGRARRGGLMRGNGRPRSEIEEREFRRRAAALNIQISPYFRRRS